MRAYAFHLATSDKKGSLIDRRLLAVIVAKNLDNANLCFSKRFSIYALVRSDEDEYNKGLVRFIATTDFELSIEDNEGAIVIV